MVKILKKIASAIECSQIYYNIFLVCVQKPVNHQIKLHYFIANIEQYGSLTQNLEPCAYFSKMKRESQN